MSCCHSNSVTWVTKCKLAYACWNEILLGERRALTHTFSIWNSGKTPVAVKCCSYSFFDVVPRFHNLLHKTHPSSLTKACAQKATPPPLVITFNTKDVARSLKTILRITHHFSILFVFHRLPPKQSWRMTTQSPTPRRDGRFSPGVHLIGEKTSAHGV